jgi:hypothetical protein
MLATMKVIAASALAPFIAFAPWIAFIAFDTTALMKKSSACVPLL